MKYLLLVPVLLLISACASKPVTEYVYVKEAIELQVSKPLTTKCVPDKPIDHKTYSDLTSEQREVFLSNYIIGLLGSLKKCDIKREGILKQVNTHNQLALETVKNKENLDGTNREGTNKGSINKITDTFMESESNERRELTQKLVKFFTEDTTDNEKLVITTFLFNELGHSEIVKKHIQNETILLKVYQVLGMSLGIGSFLIFLSALFYSDHFIITAINNYLMSVFKIIGFH